MKSALIAGMLWLAAPVAAAAEGTTPQIPEAPGTPQARNEPTEARRHLLVVVEMGPEGTRLGLSRLVDQPLPRARDGRWRVELLAADGSVLYAAPLRDPGVLRGEFHGEPMDAVHIRRATVAFALRLPLHAAAARIRVLAPAADLPAADPRAAGADPESLVEVGSLAFPEVGP